MAAHQLPLVFPRRLKNGMLVFQLRKNRITRSKTPLEQDENQQQTQPTYITGPKSNQRIGEKDVRFYPCAIPAPQTHGRLLDPSKPEVACSITTCRKGSYPERNIQNKENESFALVEFALLWRARSEFCSPTW